jgi:serine/threonine protein kinase/tetratricopeptide (TPR) repeat protein
VKRDNPDVLAALADRYSIERELGRGSSAVVYLAHDRRHDRKVAVKVLLPELVRAVSTERFLREISFAARLNPPHILPLLDSGNAGGALYYVMPYVDGETVRDLLQRETQLPVEDALRITRQVAAALSYAHGHGVLHRDIKPENILLQAGEAVVADFGIARALTTTDAETVAETALVAGTPAYMSPEQATGSREVDGRSDIYSLACVLYEMLAGHPPFTGATAQEILSRHTLDPVPSLRAARTALPQAVDQSVVRALAKQPADRFATAAQFAASLSAPDVGVRSRRRTTVYTGVLLVILLAGLAVASGLRREPDARPTEKSIAVLPFINLSTDPTQESFSEGMTEELINALSRVEGLRVPGRTSSYAFQGKEVPIKTIADALKVATVLEGTVRTSGSRLRVSARLVNVADGYQVWSQEYDRVLGEDAKDVFAIQDDVSRAIVSALQVKLAPAPARPENLEAYQLYLKGRLFWNKGGEESLHRAREFFSAAIAIDSGYAQAYAGLADTYERLLFTRYLTRAEAYPKARAAAFRAVELGPQLAEAYTSRGLIRNRHEWDWSGAGQDFLRAIALSPGYPLGHLWYGQFLGQLGRTQESLREASRAAELDPLSAQVLINYGIALTHTGQYEAAAAQVRKALELEPNSADAHQRLGEAYLHLGHFADAIREFQTTRSLLGRRGRVVPVLVRLGIAYARSGHREQALQILENLKSAEARGETPPSGFAVNLAYLYGELGDKDRAFLLLDKAYQEHDHNLTNLRVNPLGEPLRSDPRFKPLLKKVGLEE